MLRHEELKHNLEDVYDVDNMETMSSTKWSLTSMTDRTSGEGKSNLLILKQEK